MSDKETDDKQNLFNSALQYIADRLATSKKSGDYPLNRGDIILLVMLIEQELRFAPSDWEVQLNAKRLSAIREKLGDLASDAPQMCKAEAQKFRE